MQICRARPIGGPKGDNAIAINVLATQETSGFGFSWQSKEEAFTDEHDVVLVPLHWGNRRESKNSAAQPYRGPGTEVMGPPNRGHGAERGFQAAALSRSWDSLIEALIRHGSEIP